MRRGKRLTTTGGKAEAAKTVAKDKAPWQKPSTTAKPKPGGEWGDHNKTVLERYRALQRLNPGESPYLDPDDMYDEYDDPDFVDEVQDQDLGNAQLRRMFGTSHRGRGPTRSTDIDDDDYYCRARDRQESQQNKGCNSPGIFEVETFDFVRMRNEKMEGNVKKSLENFPNWQPDHKRLHTVISSVSPTSEINAMRRQESTIQEENNKVSFDGDTSDSEGPEPVNKLERFEKVVEQIVEDASAANRKLLEGGGGGVPFCYFKFQDALRAKWNIIKLERMENLLRGKFVEACPPEWEDFDKEFVKIYGPMDQDSDAYKLLLLRFRTQRLQMYIEMISRENDVLGAMLQNSILPSSCSGVADEIQAVRSNLESSLAAVEEANVDLNPYTSRMDFFVLPRPLHPITIYVVRPDEVEGLSEFKLGRGISLFLGYNPALHDVGCTFPTKVIGDERRAEYFEGAVMRRRRRAVREWPQRVFQLREGLKEYPLGVEANFYCNEFRKRWGLLDDEPIFGKYSDSEGVLRLSDVFYPQKLGKDQRVILFHGLLQDMIVPPKDILFRIWNRIKFLLEKNRSIEVTELGKAYETYYQQPLHVLNWGFKDNKEFLSYCFELFPEELRYVTTADEQELKNITKVEEKRVSKQAEMTSDNKYYRSLLESQLAQEWFSEDEELPDSHVCELPFPNPFEFD